MRILSSVFVITTAVLAINAHAGYTQAPDRVEQLIDQLETSAAYDQSERQNTVSFAALNERDQRSATTKTTPVFSGLNSQHWMQAFPLPKDSHRISSTFGSRVMGGRVEHHQGLDFAAPTGTPIYATGDGVVTKAGWGNGYGQYVEINHGNGYLTRYGHASRLHVQVGDRVQAGDEIANVGCTGRCTGPHLHYEVVKDGERRNPSTYLALLP